MSNNCADYSLIPLIRMVTTVATQTVKLECAYDDNEEVGRFAIDSFVYRSKLVLVP